jgi:dienelactone hydrolase
MRSRLALLALLFFPFTTFAEDLPKKRFTAATPAEAEQWQQESRKLLFDLLHMSDLVAKKEPIPLAPKPGLHTKFSGKFLQREVEINSTPTRRIKIIVTVPDHQPGKKFPAVVCIHGHGGDRNIVYRPGLYNAFARELAERGFVTISTDVGQHQVYEKGRTLMGERLWDVMRCVDYLASLPEVDKERLGCAGLSLGGEMAMWLGAMDPRIKATVSSGFLTTVANMRQGHCPCWDFPGLTENFDFADIYSLTAPRALMCQNGQKEGAPGGFPVRIAQTTMKEIQRAYRVFNAENKAVLDVHPEGHVFVVPSAVKFLEEQLKKQP